MLRPLLLALLDSLVLVAAGCILGRLPALAGRDLGPVLAWSPALLGPLALLVWTSREIGGEPAGGIRRRVVTALLALASWPALVLMLDLDLQRKRVVLVGLAAALYLVVGAPLVRRCVRAAGGGNRPSILLAAILVIAGGVLWIRPMSSSRGPGGELQGAGWNVLLVTIDTTRVDILGCYGQAWDTSPRMDALAREGVLFEQAIAQAPHTHSSIASLLTSTYPAEHRSLRDLHRLEDFNVTFAELLSDAGYTTAAFLDNPWLTRELGFDQGYQTFVERAETDEILSWLRANHSTPFLLHVHLLHPHAPFESVQPWAANFQPDYPSDAPWQTVVPIEVLWDSKLRADVDMQRYGVERDVAMDRFRALYASEVRRMDQQVGELLDGLADLGLAEDTIVVVVADHGEEFLDHGSLGHSHSLYDELVHVPLIVRFPKSFDLAGRRVSEQAELNDVVPTLLEALGLPVSTPLRGGSWLPHLRGSGPAPPSSETAVSQLYRIQGRHIFSLRTPGMKLISTVAPLGRDRFDDWSLDGFTDETLIWGNRHQLFNLIQDPGETHDRSTDEPAIFRELSGRLAEWSKKVESNP